MDSSPLSILFALQFLGSIVYYYTYRIFFESRRTSVNHSFPRIITLLRKEKGLSQKSAAEQSRHFPSSVVTLRKRREGMRPGLCRTHRRFLRRIHRLSARPNPKPAQPSHVARSGAGCTDRRSVSTPASRQRVIDSLVVIYDLLDRAKNRAVSQEAVTFLSCAIYRVIRQLAAHFPEPGEADLSTIAPDLARAMATAAMEMSEAHMTQSLQNSAGDQARLFPLTSRVLTERYPAHAPGLLNLMVVTEGLFASKKEGKRKRQASRMRPYSQALTGPDDDRPFCTKAKSARNPFRVAHRNHQSAFITALSQSHPEEILRPGFMKYSKPCWPVGQSG